MHKLLIYTMFSLLVATTALTTGRDQSALRPALALRGGLAGVDASTAATLGMGLIGANGVYCECDYVLLVSSSS